jgi:hypothetical protein
VPSLYPRKRTYRTPTALAISTSDATPVILLVCRPQRTMTTWDLCIRFVASAFQPLDSFLIDQSSMKNGESGFFA